ncbi:MAG: HNH endonuclease [Sandaracinaceae bacterium]|nr:MAG: HNH endonuclease [Sandaracinaceae bacterium]
MAFTNEEIDIVWEKTNRRCHICRKTVARRNHGTIGRRGSWEIDHSNPKAKGGSDRLSNLLPACVPCNRSKREGSTRAARAQHGHSRRPLSAAEIEKAQLRNAGIGGAGGLVFGAALGGPVGAAVGGIAGLALGSLKKVDE